MSECAPLRRSREHLLLPEIFLPDPELLVEIYEGEELLETYGLYQASLQDIDLGVMFRVVLLTGCHLLEHEVFENCRAVLVWQDLFCEFHFDHNHYGFLPG